MNFWFISFSVLEQVEILNLWDDFQKVVKFIDENYNWLNPIMEQVMNQKYSRRDYNTIESSSLKHINNSSSKLNVLNMVRILLKVSLAERFVSI